MARRPTLMHDEASRLDEILDVLCAIARQEFSARVEVSGTGTIDAIATGINMLAEELDGEVASRRELEAAHAALRDAQTKLVASSRMAVVGQVASGVAHEINNPAAWVTLSLSMAKHASDRARRALAGGDPDVASRELGALDAHLDLCVEGLRRISAVVGDLRTLSRDAEDSLETIAFEGLIGASVSLARPSLGEATRIVVDVQDAPPVMANRGRIAQIVTNLLVNAGQAVASAPAGAHEIVVTVHEAQGGTMLAVEDSGPGVPAELRERVFEPFFTTKGPEEGTGLGLAIVAQIAGSYGGSARVVERAGGRPGARVEVWFPRRAAQGSSP